MSGVAIPVIGGFGGGPWLDGRVRMGHAAIGYAASNVGKDGNYANVAQDHARRIHRSCRPIYAPAVRSNIERGSSWPHAIIDGIATRYEVVGSGPPLLMYSPGGFDATIEKWSQQGVYAKIKPLDHLTQAL